MISIAAETIVNRAEALSEHIDNTLDDRRCQCPVGSVRSSSRRIDRGPHSFEHRSRARASNR
jgi:hypothetical protein